MTERLSSSAARVRRYRKRRSDGVVAVVPVTVNEVEIDALVRDGKLAASDVTDRDKIAEAVKCVLLGYALRITCY